MEHNNNNLSHSYLVFELKGEKFALDVMYVINILELCPITHIPKTPAYIKGVINLRGEVLPIVDTNVKFDTGEVIHTRNTCILVLEIPISKQMQRIGILVDAVISVIEITDDIIKKPPKTGLKYQSEFVNGMIEQQDRFVMVINTKNFFSEDELLNVEQTRRAA